MTLRDYIDAGITAKNGREQLANYLGIAANTVTDAKAHRRGLPNDACIKLARLIEIDPLAIIAASELATEKKPERREFWLSFGNPAKSARLAGTALFLAIVTNFVTPNSAEAAPIQGFTAQRLCIM